MNLNVNRNIVLKIMNDSEFEKELGDIINEELAKGAEMDDGLVCDCVNALTYLKNSDEIRAADTVLSNKRIIRICHKNNYLKKRLKKSVAAAAILLVFTGAVTFTVNPAYATEVKGFVTRVVQALYGADKKTVSTNSDVKALYATFSKKPKALIKDESEINLDKMDIYAVTSDGRELKIPLSQCETEKQYIETDGEKRILVIISYGGCSFSISYTLEG